MRTPPDIPDPLALDLTLIDSAVLRRLIAEVQAELLDNEEGEETLHGPRAYDRVHNRHNRGPSHIKHPYNRVHNRHNRGR